MIITKHKHQTIINELNAVIENQSKDIETLTDQVSDLVDKVVLAKQATKDVFELLDYDENDVIIANVTNFLIDQGNDKAASVISKCKVGRLSSGIDVMRRYFLKIHLFLTGDSYDIINDEKNKSAIAIKDAFNVYFSYSHTCELLSKFYDESIYYFENKLKYSSAEIEYELNIRRIDPKESDIQLFFDKVDALKSKLEQIK